MVYLTLEKTDFEVIGFLIENLDREYSIKEISEELKRPYVKIHNSIKRLSKKSIIVESIKGKSHYCSFDYRSNKDVACFIESQISKEFLKKNKKISLIIVDITKLIKSPDYSIVLFGSYAKGDIGKHSDVDVAIISSAEEKENAERVMNSIKRLFPLKVHSLEFSYNDFVEMLKAKELNVGKEIVKNHVIFNGYEQFYECIELAK